MRSILKLIGIITFNCIATFVSYCCFVGIVIRNMPNSIFAITYMCYIPVVYSVLFLLPLAIARLINRFNTNKLYAISLIIIDIVGIIGIEYCCISNITTDIEKNKILAYIITIIVGIIVPILNVLYALFKEREG